MEDLVEIWDFKISKKEFKEFLDKNCKNDYNFNEYIKDLEKQVGETSCDYYELSSYESKSGNAETYYFTKF